MEGYQGQAHIRKDWCVNEDRRWLSLPEEGKEKKEERCKQRKQQE